MNPNITCAGSDPAQKEFSTEEPRIMFIDLNSAFATTEQQARPSLRGRPIGVTNRVSKYCCVIACSYEAKALGIKVGMNLQEALKICPGFVMLESDPPKYHYVYQKLIKIMSDYSPNFQMKSIDEGIIDFHGMDYLLKNKTMSSVGYEIKQRVKEEVGDYTTINVGIAPNRFLAKQAANWHKPDGLDVIDHRNLLDYYSQIQLTDLTGIAKRFEARLKACGVFTPLQFFDASADMLKRHVFHSVIGEDWYNRLHGHEVDQNPTTRRQVGRQFVLDIRTTDDEIILPRFHYLCETTGKKLRHTDMNARGIIVWAHFANGERWHARTTFTYSFYADKQIYSRAKKMFDTRPKHLIVAVMGITCFMLEPSNRSQKSLFEEINKEDLLTFAIDEINERYGTFMICSLNSMEGKKHVKQKIPFGSTSYFDILLR